MSIGNVIFTLLPLAGLFVGGYLFAISQSESAVELAARRRETSSRPAKSKPKAKAPKLNLKTPKGMAEAMHCKLQELEISLDSGPPISKSSPRVITLGFEPGGSFSDKHFINNHFQIVCRTLKRAPHDCRFVPRLPGNYSHYVGIEVPLSNDVEQFEPVKLDKILKSKEFNSAGVPVIVGENTFGMPLIMDLASPKNAHVYIAGTTGSGKTTLVDSILYGLLQLPDKKRPYLCVIDAAKGGEDLGKFTQAPNMYAPLADNNENARDTLVAISESLADRKKTDRKIVIAIDEIPALFDEKVNPFAEDCRAAVKNISGVGRSKGVHLILLTQNASVSVMNSDIQNNIKGRIALMCGPNQTTQILGAGWNVDGSKLFGNGDLYTIVNGQLERAQGPYVDEQTILEWMSENGRNENDNYPMELNNETKNQEIKLNNNKDDLYKLSRAIVSGYIDDGRCYGKTKLASITGLSEHAIHKNLLPELEKIGLIGPAQGRKPRHVLIPNHNRLDALFADLGDKKTYPPDRGVLLENSTFH